MTRPETIFAAVYAIGAVPARYALERRQWKEAATLTVPANVPWDKTPYAEANIHFAIGLGAARSNQPEIAQRAIDRLAAIRQTLVDQKDGAVAGFLGALGFAPSPLQPLEMRIGPRKGTS